MGTGIIAAARRRGGIYWRIAFTDTWSGANASLRGVGFNTALGGSSVATGGTAVASAGTAANAFDADSSTRWEPGAASGYIGYHFASSVSIVQCSIDFAQSPVINPFNDSPKTCTLDYSNDGSSWTTFTSFVTWTCVPGTTQTYPITPPSSGFHPLWRIYCVDNASASSIMIGNLELRATASGADQTVTLSSSQGTSSGRAFATSGTSTNSEYWQAFNPSVSLGWTAATNADEWVAYAFPSPVQVQELAITSDFTGSRQPSNLRVEYSDDGITWTSQKSIGPLTWTTGETKVIAAI